jgi:hypothetical protein
MVVKFRLCFLNALRKKCITVAIVLCFTNNSNRESSEYLAPSPPHETILVDMTLSLEYTRRSRLLWCDWLRDSLRPIARHLMRNKRIFTGIE